jgi:hypothetical protein
MTSSYWSSRSESSNENSINHKKKVIKKELLIWVDDIQVNKKIDEKMAIATLDPGASPSEIEVQVDLMKLCQRP